MVLTMLRFRILYREIFLGLRRDLFRPEARFFVLDWIVGALPANAWRRGFYSQIRQFRRLSNAAGWRMVYELPQKESGLDRYVVLSVDDGQRYVQCRFIDGDAAMSCEASSGYYGPRPRLLLSQQERLAIAEEGFLLRRGRGNFVREFPVASPADLSRIAEAMLRMLAKGYNGEKSDGVYVRTPLSDLRNVLDLGCGSSTPISQIYRRRRLGF